jgi:hypothetical protein
MAMPGLTSHLHHLITGGITKPPISGPGFAHNLEVATTIYRKPIFGTGIYALTLPGPLSMPPWHQTTSSPSASPSSYVRHRFFDAPCHHADEVDAPRSTSCHLHPAAALKNNAPMRESDAGNTAIVLFEIYPDLRFPTEQHE